MMLQNRLVRYLAVALPLLGSAILLFSCESKNVTKHQPTNLEKLMTEYSENLSIVTSENGQKSYHFTTPLMEGYALAHEPYKEFRKGIKIVTYEGDTTDVVSATLTANYAIFYETRELWEAKGDVVIIQTNGRRLYTSQLFWNQALHRIYSNVDSRVVDGDEIYDCEGFESDEEMKDWHYRKIKGVTYFTEPEPAESADSVATDGGASKSEAATPVQSKEKMTTAAKPQSKPQSKAKPKSQTATKSSVKNPSAQSGGTAVKPQKTTASPASAPKERRTHEARGESLKTNKRQLSREVVGEKDSKLVLQSGNEEMK